MGTERWTVTRDGVTRSYSAEVDVIADFVEPCGYCGAPCSGTVRVWYAEGDRRVAFETDRGSLTEPLEQLIGAAIERDEYAALPAFVRDWNEGTGWAAFGLDDGAAVAADDLLRTVDALDDRRPANDVRLGRLLPGLRALVSVAAHQGRDLWATET
jgi:hypothetical protein